MMLSIYERMLKRQIFDLQKEYDFFFRLRSKM